MDTQEQIAYSGPERRSPRRIDDKLHEKHHDFIDALLQKEADRAGLRKAIIEKTFAGLLWTALAFIGHRVATFWAEHFTK